MELQGCFATPSRQTPSKRVMKKVILSSFLLLVGLTGFLQAQTEGTQSFEQILEADAQENLTKAWFYFKSRKAYVAVLNRTDETIAAHPSFSKMNEILYLSGMASYYLYLGKGKQKLASMKLSESDSERFAKPKLKEDAMAFLTQFVDDYPQSKYVKKAKKALKDLEKKSGS